MGFVTERRMNSGHVCNYAPRKLLSIRLNSQKLKIGRHKTIILPLCEIQSLALRKI